MGLACPGLTAGMEDTAEGETDEGTGRHEERGERDGLWGPDWIAKVNKPGSRRAEDLKELRQ